MALIDDLISRVGEQALRAALAREVERLREAKKFGLVFERHLPEESVLPDATVRLGSHVALRSDRAVRGVVKHVAGTKATVVFGEEQRQVKVVELAVVKRIGEPIYPTLSLVDHVARGPGKRWHSLIEADNFHALQLLCYTHPASVDVIYIDPPYNTKKKTWKYNNNFVDGNDAFRHSKWLSFMQRRLILAKRLLKQDGVLIVAIDENELATLGMLLRDLFPQHGITPITVVHNPRGIQGDNFSYCHETLYFVIPRDKELIAERHLSADEISPSPLKKWGNDSTRDSAANCFYPIFFNSKGECVGAGPVADDNFHPTRSVSKRANGTWEYWPIDDDGEGKWRYARQSFMEVQDLLLVDDGDTCADDTDPTIVAERPIPSDFTQAIVKIRKTTGSYKTFWRHEAFDASSNGKQLVNKFVTTDFPFPKSLYAVVEALKATTGHRTDAVILDFFAGSGTTLHATMLLNAADGGSRQCILVTNNEVGPPAEKRFQKRGVSPGDDEWEDEGICRSITWPRLKNAALGHGKTGRPLPSKWTYRDPLSFDKRGPGVRQMSAGFEANIAYFRLGYTDPREVSKGAAFEGIRPILWLLAGGNGDPARKPTARNRSWLIDESAQYAVLFEGIKARPFSNALGDKVRTIFVVEDSAPAFARTVAAIGDAGSRRFVHIYRSYLESFAINHLTDI